MTHRIQVLHLEDDPHDAELARSTLEAGGLACEFVLVEGKPGYESALAQGTFDLILCDCKLLGYDGLSALALAREKQPHTPLIMLSGSLDEETAVESLRLGATDFVLKQRMERLVPVVRRALWEAEERSWREAAEEGLRAEGAFRTAVIQNATEGPCVCHDIQEPPYLAFTLWNQKMTEITGHTMEEINRLGWYQTAYPDPEVQGRAAERMRRMREGDDLRREEWEITRADGSRRLLSISTSVLPSRDGTRHVLALMEDVTERRQDERTLRMARTAMDQAADMIVWVDREGRLAYANDTALRLLGRSPEELLGMSVWDVTANVSREAWPATWEAVRQAGSRALEGTCRRKDGSVFPVDVVISHLAFGDAEMQCATMRDITERKQAEGFLLKEKAFSEAMLGSLPGIFFLFDHTGRMLRWNHLAETVSGYAAEEIAAMRPIDFFAQEDRTLIEERIGKVFQTGAADVEAALLSMDGRPIPHYFTGVRLDVDGVPCCVAMGIDISVRKNAETHLTQMEGRYRGLLEAAPDAMVVVNQGGEIVLLNVQAEKQFGYRRDELLGQQVKNIIPEGFAERLIADGTRSAADALAQQIGMGIELSARRKDGSEFPIEIMLSPLESAEGILVTAAIRDISVRRQMEARLRQAQKLEAFGQLAGGVAHDFNNILGVITGYGELAQRQLGSDHPARARVDQMVKAAERAAGLTRQLLAFGRKQVMQLKILDINSLVADTQKMLGRLIGEDIDVVAHSAPELGTVKADPGQIEQIILNLAVNARDAMPKGGSLTLETANVDLDADYAAAHPPARPGRYVMLAISDTGIGMDQETQHRIFEPFFTTKREGEGTGLGLATVYGIVKQSGGYIWVYSEPGRGTTFKVYLPRVDEPPEAAQPDSAPTEAPGGQETILLVEDTETLREVIRETLEERGYTLLLASNGEEALALAGEREGEIHLLLTDVVMPKLGGGDLAKMLLALRPRLRVLYMSGYTDGAISQHGVLGAGVMLLEKPFTATLLAQAVRKALDQG